MCHTSHQYAKANSKCMKDYGTNCHILNIEL